MEAATAPSAFGLRGGERRLGDRLFSGAAIASGIAILTVLAGVAIFLLIQAVPALSASTDGLAEGKGLVEYIAPLAFGTVLAATLAVIIAVPLAVAVALFISHIAPRALAQPLGYIVDLLAAIPSIVYGLWGDLRPRTRRRRGDEVASRTTSGSCPSSRPGLGDRPDDVRRRHRPRGDDPPDHLRRRPRVFSQAPRRQQEGALALGATRWEMIKMTVLPFGRSAVISGSMLGPAAPPRRDDGRGHHPLGLGRHHLQPDRLRQPADDRLQHREQVPRVVGDRGQRADPLRPRALRDHPPWSTWARDRSSPAPSATRRKGRRGPDVRHHRTSRVRLPRRLRGASRDRPRPSPTGSPTRSPALRWRSPS